MAQDPTFALTWSYTEGYGKTDPLARKRWWVFFLAMKKQLESDRISSSELHAALGLRSRSAAFAWRRAGYLPAVKNAGKSSFYLVDDVLGLLQHHLDERARQTYRDVKAFLKLRKELEKERTKHERTE